MVVQRIGFERVCLALHPSSSSSYSNSSSIKSPTLADCGTEESRTKDEFEQEDDSKPTFPVHLAHLRQQSHAL
jgi:hypothetical protein